MEYGGSQSETTMNLDGFSMKDINQLCIQASAVRIEIEKLLSTLMNMKSGKSSNEGHDPGDEDPSAWKNE